ncbi:MAG TPA: hypothetical protein PK605_12150 [Ignavibacteria bacterium]|nr:hypothetical protein [Bacteroidota bacterium]HRE12336.1 hypothetical protein [Ignavibacteria bacterium]HRF67300.1 hypothetical protein [Ignavibacteria bacterium]HRJ05143.1 hypothetical protein [Ignavibacteria bacterium]
MINDILISLKDNIQKRSKNPILGTFTVVYIIKNWELFYSVLFFDSNLNLEQRLQYIRNYFQYHNFWSNFFECALISVLVVFLTYLSLAFGRYVSSFYSSKVEKWIFKNTDNKKIVLKDEYDELMEKKIKFEKKYEQERNEKTDIIVARDEEINRYLELIASKNDNEVINNLKAENESMRSQIRGLNQERESLKKLIENQQEKIKQIENNIIESDNELVSTNITRKTYKELVNSHQLELFEKVNFDANAGKEYWGVSQSYDKLISMGLVKIIRTTNSNFYRVELTDLGQAVAKMILNDKLNNK